MSKSPSRPVSGHSFGFSGDFVMNLAYQAQRTQFRECGFTELPEFLSAGELADLQSRLECFVADKLAELPPAYVFYEDKGDVSSLKQIQHVWKFDSVLAELFFNGKPRKLAETLLDGPVIPKNLQWFNKPPRKGLPTPPHQDGFYFMLEPCEALTMWLALDEVDEENGCVRYIRGSHNKGMRPHGKSGTLGFSQAITDFGSPSDVENEVAIPASPGDLLAHHALTVHRADGNKSPNRNRRALGFIYYSERAAEDKAARSAYQSRLAAELQAEGKI